MDTLKNKIALITGGTSGMGAATAKRFHFAGATVVITGSSAASVEAARREMPDMEVIVSDAGDPHAAKILIDHVREKHGRTTPDYMYIEDEDILKREPFLNELEEDRYAALSFEPLT